MNEYKTTAHDSYDAPVSNQQVLIYIDQLLRAYAESKSSGFDQALSENKSRRWAKRNPELTPL